MQRVDGQELLADAIERHVVVDVHAEGANGEQRAFGVVPLDGRIEVGRQDRLEVRVAAGAGAYAAEGGRGQQAYRAGQCREVREGHRLRRGQAQHQFVGEVDLQVGAGQEGAVRVLRQHRLVRAEQRSGDCRRIVRGGVDVVGDLFLGLHVANTEVTRPLLTREVQLHVAGRVALFQTVGAREEETGLRIAVGEAVELCQLLHR